MFSVNDLTRVTKARICERLGMCDVTEGLQTADGSTIGNLLTAVTILNDKPKNLLLERSISLQQRSHCNEKIQVAQPFNVEHHPHKSICV